MSSYKSLFPFVALYYIFQRCTNLHRLVIGCTVFFLINNYSLNLFVKLFHSPSDTHFPQTLQTTHSFRTSQHGLVKTILVPICPSFLHALPSKHFSRICTFVEIIITYSDLLIEQFPKKNRTYDESLCCVSMQ